MIGISLFKYTLKASLLFSKVLFEIFFRYIGYNNWDNTFSITANIWDATTRPRISIPKLSELNLYSAINLKPSVKTHIKKCPTIILDEKEYISLVLKVSDGSHRGNYISCLRILNYLNILNKEEYTTLLEFVMAKQYNLNKIKTGELVCNILD